MPSVAVLVSLLVCLIPTTIGGLLSAIGIAGMDRVMQHNVLAMSGKAVEAAGDVQHAAARQDRHHHARQPAGGRVPPASRASPKPSWPMPRSSRAWPTKRPKAARSSCSPRRSIGCAAATSPSTRRTFIPFSAYTRMSGVDFEGRQLRKGATDAIVHVRQGARRRRARRVHGGDRAHCAHAAARRWPSPTAGACSASFT